MLNMEASNQ